MGFGAIDFIDGHHFLSSEVIAQRREQQQLGMSIDKNHRALASMASFDGGMTLFLPQFGRVGAECLLSARASGFSPYTAILGGSIQ